MSSIHSGAEVTDTTGARFNLDLALEETDIGQRRSTRRYRFALADSSKPTPVYADGDLQSASGPLGFEFEQSVDNAMAVSVGPDAGSATQAFGSKVPFRDRW